MSRNRSRVSIALLGAALVAVPAAAAQAAAPADRAFAARSAPRGPAPSATAKGAFVPREVVVRYRRQRAARAFRLPRGVGVRRATRALRRNPRVAYALPNYIATASYVPNDPGTVPPQTGRRGGWIEKQWNFRPCGSACSGGAPLSFEAAGGIDAPAAWRHLARAGRPGARGVTVAVLDTGIAYRTTDRFRRSPDFGGNQFVRGHDFVSGDELPLDVNGHGTHVAGTIAERANNGIGLTGLAHRAKLMPVRVLNAAGNGESDDIAKGIRFAAHHGADVINMSFNFACRAPVKPVAEALRMAHRKRVVLVGSAGNREPRNCVSMPATAPNVIGVGGTTINACVGAYSRFGRQIDLVAPGGGADALATGCGRAGGGPPILQLTLKPGSRNRFGFPGGFIGTSMAAAHVSGTAAMVIASEVVGNRPGPNRVARRLRETARDLGAAGRDRFHGCGLIDAGAAVDPAAPVVHCPS